MSTGEVASFQAADDASPTTALLITALEAAVPLWIMQTAQLTPDQRSDRARTLATIIASQGDSILYRSLRPGGTAAAFNALAEGLALAAYQSGGITVAGRHWCANHFACRQAWAAAGRAEARP
jgi:hypothetical protein